MFNKIKTSYLLIAFAVLLGIYLVVKNYDEKRGERTFKSELVNVDLNDVTQVTIYPKHGIAPMKFYMEDGRWIVEQNGAKYNASKNAVENFTRSLNSITPERVAAISKDKWSTYEVTDSAGVRVIMENGKKKIADIIIGRFSYSQQEPNPNVPQNQQQRGKMTSFVRLYSDKEVYAVDGMIAMTFDREVRHFRDQTVISGNKNQWTKLTVTHPGDSSFTLEKVNSKWLLNGQPTDSTSVDVYLGGLRDIVSSEFSNLAEAPTPEHTLLIEGDGMPAPIKVTAAKVNNNYVITSSQNVGALFQSKPKAFFAKIFAKRPKLRATN